MEIQTRKYVMRLFLSIKNKYVYKLSLNAFRAAEKTENFLNN